MSNPLLADEGPSDRRSARPITLADLTDDLLWTRLLRSPALACRPSSVMLALFAIILAGLTGELTRLWTASNRITLSVLTGDELLRAGGTFARGLWTGVVGGNSGALVDAFAGVALVPRTLWDEFAWGSLLLIPMAGIVLVAGLAIARLAALDFAHGVRLHWVDALGFALRRGLSAVLSFLAPALVCLLIFGALALTFWALFATTWTGVVGGVLFPLALLAGAVATAVLVLTVLGAPMLIASLAVEGGDWIESIQRTFAYVPARPLKYALYLLVLVGLGWVSITVAFAIGGGVLRFTVGGVTALAPEPPSVLIDPDRPETGVTAWLLRLGVGLPMLLAGAYAMSFVFSASSVLYLVVRRAVDGQAMSEVWMPGMLPGTVAPATAETHDPRSGDSAGQSSSASGSSTPMNPASSSDEPR